MASHSANNATDDMATAGNTANTVNNKASIHTDTDSSKKKIKHKPTINKPAPLGHDYEINILMLTYLDAIEKERKFKHDFNMYIGTEVLDTSPFEDIVYVEVQQNEATSWYIQVKHSLTSFPIHLKELLTDNSKRDKISLLKYFESIRIIKESLKQDNSYYSKIKEITKFTKDSHKFVIFSNRPINHEEVKGLKDITEDVLLYKSVEEGEQIEISDDPDSQRTKSSLMTKVNQLCKGEVSEDPNSLYQKMKSSLITKAKEEKGFTFTEKELIEFFDDFIFATSQPNVNKLKLRVENKLRQITGLPETKWVANTLAIQLSQWAHQKDGYFLDRNTKLFKYINQHLASWRQIVYSLNKLDNTKKHGVAFKDDVKVVQDVADFLNQTNKDEPQICVVYYEHLNLTEMKIVQAINDNIKYETIFFDLERFRFKEPESYFNIIEAFESEGSNFLVITVNAQSEWVNFSNVATIFFDILKTHSNKKIILVLPPNLDLLEYNHKVIKDKENSFCDLSKESHEEMLKERAVLFKGQRINLHLLVDENLENSINEQFLADIIREDIIIKTTHIIDEYELDCVKHYYIPRQLRRIRIQNKVLELKEQFCFINGDNDDFDGINDKKDIIIITTKKDASAFDRMCKKSRSSNIHWLVKENGSMYWQKSQGSPALIRNYIHNYNLCSSEAIYDDEELSSFSSTSSLSEKFDKLCTSGLTWSSEETISEDDKQGIYEDSESDEQTEYDKVDQPGINGTILRFSKDVNSKDEEICSSSSSSSHSKREKYTEVKKFNKPGISGLTSFSEQMIPKDESIEYKKYDLDIINNLLAIHEQESEGSSTRKKTIHNESGEQTEYGKVGLSTIISGLTWFSKDDISKDEKPEDFFTAQEKPRTEMMSTIDYKSKDDSDFVTLEDIENRVTVITAEPGMGKSTLLSNFERSIKSTDVYKEQTLLVAKTNLSNHSTEFKKLSKINVTIEDAIKFLIASLNFESEILTNSHLLKVDQNGNLRLPPKENIKDGRIALYLKVFAYFYNESKIIALLDGFDEIAPAYDIQVLNLLEVLTKTKVRKIIITTRPYGIVSDLERRLDTLSYTLIPFSRRDQLNFLNKIWKHKLEISEEIEEKLRKFIKKCEKIFFANSDTMSVNDNKFVFVSIPQHIQMVATVYMSYFHKYLQTGEFEDMTKDLNLYSLYDKFFQLKFGILNELAISDKSKDIIASALLQKPTKIQHGKLAMIELFEEEKLEKIITEDEKFDLMSAVLNAEEKTGIVYIGGHGEPRFVHRTFAEYFAADLLADMLKDTRSHKRHEIAQRFLYEMVTEPKTPFKLVFMFLNYKFISQCPYNECNECNVCIYRVYFNAALNDISTKITEIENITNVRDFLDRTPLHLCFYSAIHMNSLISLNNKFNSELYLKDTLFHWTALHYFAMNTECGNFKYSNDLPNYSEIAVNPEVLQDIDGKTPLMLAIEHNPKAVYFLVNEIPVAHHLKDRNGNTCLHYFTANMKQNSKSYNENSLRQKSKIIIRSNFNPLNNKILEFERKVIDMFLLSGANFFEPNIKGVTPCTFMLKSREGCNLLYTIMLSNQVQYMIKWKNNLSSTNAKLQDSEGKSILHHAVAADACFTVGITECFLKYQAVVGVVDLQDREGKTALHNALSEANCTRQVFSLLKCGAGVTIEDNEGSTPIKMLFDKICSIELNRDNEFEIFRSLPVDVITAMCRRQCKPRKPCHENWSVDEFAHDPWWVRWDSIKLRHFINICDRYGKTAAHYTVSSGNIENIRHILKYKPNLYIEDHESRIPADAILENDDILEMLDCQRNLREQFHLLLLSMTKTKVHKNRLLLKLGRYKNIAYYLIDNNAINVNANYGGKTLYNVLCESLSTEQ